MSRIRHRVLLATVAGLSLAAAGAVSARQPSGEAQPVDNGMPVVSEPEPAPNPVAERRQELEAGGIDPELGSIEDPDSVDVPPALVIEGDGSWITPEEAERRRLARDGSAGGAMASAGAAPVMPQLVGPNIPIVPLELLFPQALTTASGERISREVRGTSVVLTGLDRVSGELRQLRVPARGETRFGTLTITVRGCYHAHPDDPMESWAYVEIVDSGRAPRQQLAVLPQRDRTKMREAAEARTLRQGWMIASSPTVTAVDHPVFDVWLNRCEGDAGGPAPRSPQDAGSPAAGTAPPETAPPRATTP